MKRKPGSGSLYSEQNVNSVDYSDVQGLAKYGYRDLVEATYFLLTVRKADALADLKARHSERLVIVTVDMTDTAGLRRVVDESFAQLGRIDVIVSNAGYGASGRLHACWT